MDTLKENHERGTSRARRVHLMKQTCTTVPDARSAAIWDGYNQGLLLFNLYDTQATCNYMLALFIFSIPLTGLQVSLSPNYISRKLAFPFRGVDFIVINELSTCRQIFLQAQYNFRINRLNFKIGYICSEFSLFSNRKSRRSRWKSR